MNLSEATEAYQVQLETARIHDDEEVAEDLIKARREMEIAWLEYTTEAK